MLKRGPVLQLPLNTEQNLFVESKKFENFCAVLKTHAFCLVFLKVYLELNLFFEEVQNFFPRSDKTMLCSAVKNFQLLKDFLHSWL